MTTPTLREAAQAVLDQWEGWEPMPGECEELALSFDKLAEALATPEPDGKDAALEVMDDDELPGLLELQSKVAKQTWPHSIDASAWADEFRSRFPAVPRDEAIGWFANAIMAGYDTAQMRDTAEVERLRAWGEAWKKAAEAWECGAMAERYGGTWPRLRDIAISATTDARALDPQQGEAGREGK